MNDLSLNWNSIAEWFLQLLVFDPQHPLMMGSIAFALLFCAFYVVYAALKSRCYPLMLCYVILFSLFFAYRANGLMAALLLLTAVENYLVTLRMRQCGPKGRKWWLGFVLILNLSLLCYYKYSNFIISDVLNRFFATNFSLLEIALPIGISFYTFQAISYAVDVYRGDFKQDVTLLEYCFYLTFFPLLMAGPITRAQHLIPCLRSNRKTSSRLIWKGLFLIMLGLIKKNIMGDYLAQYNNWVFDDPTSFSGFEDMMAVWGYAVQLYLDFSGYSDMSIGVAALMGFALPENFLSPYSSLNLTDFWRRWHISLSTWFRDYVYIPLGGNRKGTFRMYLNNFLTMLVAGFWHGSSWMFIIWGALHGVGLMIHKFFSRQLHWSIPNRWWGNILSWLLTYTFVSVAFSLFRARDLQVLTDLYVHLFTDFSWDYLLPFLQARTLWCVFLLLVLLSYLVSPRHYRRLVLRFIRLPWVVKLLLFIVCLQCVVEFSLQEVQPFIYYQF